MVSQSDQIFDRTPPHDPLAEMSVNGAAILNPSAMPAMIEAGYRSGVFHDGDNRQLAAAILRAYADHGTIDKTLILAALNPHIEALTGRNAMALLIRTIEAVPHAENWPHHLGIIREHWAKRQTFLIAQRMLTSSMNGAAAADIASNARESLQEISLMGSDPAKRFPSYTLADLESMELETKFLVDGVLVKGQPALLAGAQKTLKTCIEQDLSLSLATGGYFLGMFKVPNPVRVCIATGESGLATVRETFRRQCQKVGRHPADVSGLIVSDKLPWLGGDGNDLPALRKWLLDNGAQVLFLDPVYFCIDTGGNEASLFAMGKQLRPLLEMCQEIEVTIVLLHHAKRVKRSDGYQVMQLADLAYAGFPELARQWLLLSRRAEFDPETGKHELYLNIGGSAGHHSLWALDIDEGHFPNRTWEVELRKASEARRKSVQDREAAKQARAEEKRRIQIDLDKAKILRVLKPEPQTYTKIRDTSGVSAKKFGEVLAEVLADHKSIVACEVPAGNGRSYPGYRLAPDQPEGASVPPVPPVPKDGNGTAGTDSTAASVPPLPSLEGSGTDGVCVAEERASKKAKSRKQGGTDEMAKRKGKAKLRVLHPDETGDVK